MSSRKTQPLPETPIVGQLRRRRIRRVLVLPVLNLDALPATLDGYDGVLSEPSACVAHCLLSPSVVNAGDDVVVLGPGAMGQLAAQVARAQGGKVTLAGLPEMRAGSKLLKVSESPSPPRHSGMRALT